MCYPQMVAILRAVTSIGSKAWLVEIDEWGWAFESYGSDPILVIVHFLVHHALRGLSHMVLLLWNKLLLHASPQ